MGGHFLDALTCEKYIVQLASSGLTPQSQLTGPKLEMFLMTEYSQGSAGQSTRKEQQQNAWCETRFANNRLVLTRNFYSGYLKFF